MSAHVSLRVPPDSGVSIRVNGAGPTGKSAADLGAVIGPASVTDGNPALFDGTTGKLIKQATFAAFKTSLAIATADITDASANGKSLITSATYATMKALLDLEIGVDVQAYSANLDEYAAVNPTAAGLALLDDADASAQRTTLGLGALAVLNSVTAALISDASANGRSLITAATYAAMKALLDLEIGIDVQAYDANLTTWAAKTVPAGVVIGTTDAQILTNKTYDASLNTLSNITTAMFAANVVDTDAALAANSATRISSQSAVKSYVDGLVTGIKWKASVKARTTANITLSGNQTIDGYASATNDRILVANQTAGAANGIYLSAVGAWTRALDADTSAEITGAATLVEQGTLYADTIWTLSTDAVTLDTTPLVFVQVSGAGTYSAGTGLALTANQFSISTAGVTNALLADMAAATVKGRASGAGTGVPTDLSSAQLSTILGLGALATLSSVTVAQISDASANGRSLISAATYAAMKALLDLEIGIDVQAYSANLDEYAAVNPTAAGLALLDDADASAQRTTLGLAEQLTADRIYYVRTDGSNSNTGLVDTAGGAFLTIQKAVDSAYTLDCGKFKVTIQIGAGTYANGATLIGRIRNAYDSARRPLQIIGDVATPANVVISTTSNNAISLWDAVLYLDGVTLQTTTGGYGMLVQHQSSLGLGNIRLGNIAGEMIACQYSSVIEVNGTMTVAGDGESFCHVTKNSLVSFTNQTIDFAKVGGNSFSGYVWGINDGSVGCDGCTLTGAIIAGNSTIHDQSIINFYSVTDSMTTSRFGPGTLTIEDGSVVTDTLQATLNYYVNPLGSDNNDGLANTAARAFLTIQGCIDYLYSIPRDHNQFSAGLSVKINLADGTYAETVKPRTMSAFEAVRIIGNAATPTNVVISGAADAINASVPVSTGYSIESCRLIAASGSGIRCENGNEVSFTGIDFNTATNAHIFVSNGGTVECAGNYTISGGALHHILATENSLVDYVAALTVTLTANVTFSTSTVRLRNSSVASIDSTLVTWSLGAFTVTGTRFTVTELSVLNTNGGAATYIPGTIAGTSVITVADGGTGVATITGLVKANGTSAFSAAAAGTDYYAPGSTDVAIADGGTGASTAIGAVDNLHTQGSNIASASTTDLSAATGLYVIISGSVTITALGTCAAGVLRIVRFSGAPLITHNATSLALPGNANIQVAGGDSMVFVSHGSGNWRCVLHEPSGAIGVNRGGTGAVTLTGLLSGNGTGAITGSATINDGNWSGTDLTVANGGTGASTAATAIANLGGLPLAGGTMTGTLTTRTSTTGAGTEAVVIPVGGKPASTVTGALWNTGDLHFVKAAGSISLGGPIFDYATNGANSGTSETDLYSDSIPANMLAANFDKLEATYGGSFVASATATRQIKIYFGGTVVFDSTAILISAAASWSVYVTLIRASSTTARVIVELATQNAPLAAYVTYTALATQDFTIANVLRITGTAAGVGAATNDIIARLGVVEFKPAALL